MRYVCRIVDLPNNRLHDALDINETAGVPCKICVIIIDTDKGTRADYNLPEDLKAFLSEEKKTYGVFRDRSRKTTHLRVVHPDDVKILNSLKLVKRTDNPATKTRFKAIAGSPVPHLYDLDGVYTIPAPYCQFSLSVGVLNPVVNMGTVIRTKSAPMWLSEDGKTLRIQVLIDNVNPHKRTRRSENLFCYYKIRGNDFFNTLTLGQAN